MRDEEKYLLETVGLDPKKRKTYMFQDGTGFYGTPAEFAPYAKRRFAARPNDTYEIMDEDDHGSESFEILTPTYEGQVLEPSKKRDDRF